MIWIIGGTSEARELIHRIKDLDNFIVTVATEDGREFIDDTENLIVSRLSLEEMVNFIDERKIKLIVDLTHPFAKIVSENAKIAASQKDIEYLRFVRDTVSKDESVINVKSYEEAYNYIENIKGTVFFTTGSKNIKDFEKIRGDNRFIYRILPSKESIEIANKEGVSMPDIVAILGPFSKEYNKTMLKEYKADYCVSKDSGKKGGTQNKIDACKELGIKMILIGREEEEGYRDLSELEDYIRKFRG